MNEIEIIRGAREILSDPKRWHRGNYADDSLERMCILGALGMASDRANVYATVGGIEFPALYRATQAVQQHIPADFEFIPQFNDDDSTTHQDVLNVLDKTLADLGGL